ncbi:MAG: peptidyl-prolyl cis-trans isomerase [Neisseria sp.]|nr:peptidyl-prolyl cis-trans isomerase [Neisseria sp.]
MMKKTLLTLTLLASTSIALAQTLATVNGTKIDSKEIDQQIAALKKQSNGQIQDSPELRNSILSRMVVHTVIVQEARKLKLDESKEYKDIVAQAAADASKSGEDKKSGFKQEFEAFKENLLEQAYAVHILQTNPVSDKEVRSEYDEMSKFYKGSQEVQLAEIVTKTEADAQKVLAELKAGKKFADVAKQYTIDEVGKKNGGLHQGYINLKDMAVGAPPLHAAINPLKKGQYTTGALSTGEIFAIFSVQDKRTAKIPPFEQVKDSLTAQLQDQRVNQAIDALMKKATIK